LKVSRRGIMTGIVTATGSSVLAAHVHVPGMSVSKAPSLFDSALFVTGADGSRLALATLKGRTMVATMFFATCPDVCPMMIDRLRGVTSKLPARQQARLQFLLISFDPAHDRPEVLRAYAAAHGLPTANWTVAVADAGTSEHLATILDVKFRRLGEGSFSHVPMISLIDSDGTIAARLSSSSLETPLFAAAVDGLLS